MIVRIMRTFWAGVGQCVLPLMLYATFVLTWCAAANGWDFAKTLPSGDLVYMTHSVVGVVSNHPQITWDLVQYELWLSNSVEQTVIYSNILYQCKPEPALSDVPEDLLVYDVYQSSPTNLLVLSRTRWIGVTEVAKSEEGVWETLWSTNLANYCGGLESFPTNAMLGTNVAGELEASWLMPYTTWGEPYTNAAWEKKKVWTYSGGSWIEAWEPE